MKRVATYAEQHERDAGTTKHKRQCAKCNDWKPLRFFRKRPGCNFGVGWECYLCYSTAKARAEKLKRRMSARAAVVAELPRHPGSAPTLAMGRIRALWSIPKQDQDLWTVGRRLT